MLEKIPAPTPREDLHVLVIDNQGLVHDVIASALHEIGIKNEVVHSTRFMQSDCVNHDSMILFYSHLMLATIKMAFIFSKNSSI